MAVGATVYLCNSGAMKTRAHLSKLVAIFVKSQPRSHPLLLQYLKSDCAFESQLEVIQ